MGLLQLYRGTYKGEEVAIKKLKFNQLQSIDLEEFKREVTILDKLRHHNLVEFVGAVLAPKNLALVTKYQLKKLIVFIFFEIFEIRILTAL